MTSDGVHPFHRTGASASAIVVAVACFAGASITVGQESAAVDAAARLVATVEWLEVGASGGENVADPDNLKSVYQALETHLATNPDDVRALILLGRLARFGFYQPIVLSQRQVPSSYEARFDLAIMPLKRALELAPDNAEAHYWLARAYAVTLTTVADDRLVTMPLDGEEAILQARAALALAPAELRYREALAVYLATAQRYTEAIGVFGDDAGRDHIIRRILAGFEAIPVPTEARYRPHDSEDTADEMASQGKLDRYPRLRVRTYVAGGAPSVFEDGLRQQWPDLEFHEVMRRDDGSDPKVVARLQILQERDGELQPLAASEVERLVATDRHRDDGVSVTLIEVIDPLESMTAQYGLAHVDRFTVLSIVDQRKIERDLVALTEVGERLLGEWQIESWSYSGSRGPESYSGTLNVTAQLSETELDGELFSRSQSGDWGRQHMQITVDGDRIELVGRMVAAGDVWFADTLSLTLAGDRLSGTSVDATGEGGSVVLVKRGQ